MNKKYYTMPADDGGYANTYVELALNHVQRTHTMLQWLSTVLSGEARNEAMQCISATKNLQNRISGLRDKMNEEKGGSWSAKTNQP